LRSIVRRWFSSRMKPERSSPTISSPTTATATPMKMRLRPKSRSESL
jgi:hypothetical protein